jgi:hypothetical protein
LVLEQGATFPFEVARYRGGSDTAIIVQQHGESPGSLTRRIRHSAKELQRSGVTLETVALIVSPHAMQTQRRSTVLALAEHLDAHRTLVLVADRGAPSLQHELISLVGTLIEQDHIKQSIAVDFDAARMAEPRGEAAPLLERPEPITAQHHAEAS